MVQDITNFIKTQRIMYAQSNYWNKDLQVRKEWRKTKRSWTILNVLKYIFFALDINLYNESLEQTIAVNISLDKKIILVFCQSVQFQGRDASPCQLPLSWGKQDVLIRGNIVPLTLSSELSILLVALWYKNILDNLRWSCCINIYHFIRFQFQIHKSLMNVFCHFLWFYLITLNFPLTLQISYYLTAFFLYSSIP